MAKGKSGSKKFHFRSAKDKKNPQQKPWDERDKQASYPSIVKENASFEKFYQAQKIVASEEEWAQFMEAARQPLPSDFRISSHCAGQAEVMRQQIMNLSKLTVPSPAAAAADDDDVQEEAKKNGGDKPEANSSVNKLVVSSMPWYPNRLAWSINLPKMEIRKSPALSKLHHFLISETETGDISRQEAVSMIPPLLLQVRPGHSVLDMCAAPGSKTAQIIEMLHADSSMDFVVDADGVPVLAKQGDSGNKALNGLVVANDLDNKRCYMLVHQSNRLHSPCVVITNHDASAMPTFYKSSSASAEDGSKTTKTPLKFDRVLADVPCTGDGTLRKNYDVWSKWNAANSNNFHHMQAKIARRGLELLAKDGLMAYSTCSLNPSEDESVVASLLNDSKGALELVDAAATLPELKHLPGLEHWTVMSRDGVQYAAYEEVPEKLRTQIRETLFPPANAAELRLRRCVRILPHYQNTGGFFIAILRKKTDRMPWEPTEEEEEAKKREQEEEEEKKKKEEEAAGGEGGGADKTEEDKTSLSTGRGGKKRQFFGYKEVPFSFLTKDDADWADIKSFFKLPESFNVQQLAHRCAVGKRRNLYFFTERAADFVALNGHVKIISGGCRVFCRVDISQVPCAFRVSQEGIPSLFPYFVPHLEQYAPVVDSTEANPKRTFTITDLDLETFVKVLRQEEVKIELLPPATRSKLEGVTHGGAILYTKVARPHPNSSSTFMVALCAWKGRNSVRAYVARNEKLHLMRLCGVEEPKLDTPTGPKKEGQAKSKSSEEAENKNGDNQEDDGEEESAPLKKYKLDEEEKEKVEA